MTPKRVLKVLAAALIVHLFVIPQIGGARKALTVLGSLDPFLLLLALGLEVVSFAAYARLTQLLLPTANRPGFGVTFGTVMASTGVNHVVPGGAATTAAVNYRLLGRADVPADLLGFALGLQAVGSAVVLNVLLWGALMVSIPTTGFHPIYASAAGVGAIVMGAFAFVVVAMMREPDVLARRVGTVAGKLPRVESRRVEASMHRFAAQLKVLARDRGLLRTVAGLAAANWLLDAAALWVVLGAFGHRPSVVGLLVAYGLANVLAAVPVSPGGLGVVEAVLIPTLVGFGTPPAEASVGVVAYRLMNFWLPIPVGAASYVAVERATSATSRHGFRGEVNRQLARPEHGDDEQSPIA